MLVRDIMTKDVITVTLETSLDRLADLFVKHRISGVPVVDADGGLIGIVTENDLIRKNSRLHIPTVVRIFDALIYLEPSRKFEEEVRKMTAATVEEIATRDVVTVSADTAVEEVATIMTERGVHVIPVLDDGALVGIVGKIDLIRSMSGDAR
jgi:CBS domain-containing protein